MKFVAVWDQQDSCSHNNGFWTEGDGLEPVQKDPKFPKVPRTRGKPTSPEFQALHNIARRIRPLIRGSMTKGIRTFQKNINLHDLAEAISTADPALALATVPWEKFDESIKGLDKAILTGVSESAEKSKFLYKRAIKQLVGVSPDIRFDATNEQISKWIANHTGELIENVKISTQQAIQGMISTAINDGVPPRVAAKNIKQVIGLNTRQARAVENRRRILIQQGMKGTRLESVMQAFVDKQLTHRSETIARTEAMFVNNRGLTEVISQNISDGFVDRKKAQKKWIVTPYDRVCKICKPMQGAVVGVDQDFYLAVSGQSIPHPPAHLNCNCSWALIFEEE